MGIKLLSCVLAIAATPVLATTVSSTSILINSSIAKDRQHSHQKKHGDISFIETVSVRNSLVKTPSIVITPQDNSRSLLLSKINHFIDSVSPISGNIQTNISVSVTKKPESFSTRSFNISELPEFSKDTLLSSTSSQSSLVHPAPETQRVASVFGWRVRPFSGRLQMHNGIDYGASLGSPVVAAKDGIVTKVVSGCLDFRQRWCGSQFGNWIEIDHGNGMVATYAHLLNGSITVKEGTKVWQNQEIAQVGSSGWSTGAHLDFRIKVNGEFENPAKYVKN